MQDSGTQQHSQGTWTGTVTMALAPRWAAPGLVSPGTAARSSLAAEGGVWPAAPARRCQAAGHCGTQTASFHSAALFWFKK